MFGDVLKRRMKELKKSSTKSHASNAFWKVLKSIALEEIIVHGQPVDSDLMIPVYYEILKENCQFIPKAYCQKLPSNGQEKFRVILRNILSSNAFHKDGLANSYGIIAKKQINENKKGYRIIYEKDAKALQKIMGE